MPPLATAVAALLRSAGLSYVNSPPAATARPKKLSSTFGDNAVGFGRLAALTSVAPNRKHQLDGASSCTSATLKPNGRRYAARSLASLFVTVLDSNQDKGRQAGGKGCGDGTVKILTWHSSG